mgnify:CR=1 FL=1
MIYSKLFIDLKLMFEHFNMLFTWFLQSSTMFSCSLVFSCRHSRSFSTETVLISKAARQALIKTCGEKKRKTKDINRLPKEDVDVPSLEAFKARLDVALRNAVWWLATLHTVGGVETRWPLWSISNQAMLWFYDMIKTTQPTIYYNQVTWRHRKQ